MKHLLTILLLLPLFGFAQDSTSYTTQEVKEFVPLNIMDEYEKVYNVEQKTALKFGFMSTPNEFNMNFKPFAEFGRKINSKNAVIVGLMFTDYLYRTTSNRNMLLNFLYPNFEFKHYFKDTTTQNNFNGRYISFFAKTIPVFKDKSSIDFFDTTNEIVYRNALELRYGYQFGSLLDMSIAIGFSKSYKAKWQLDESLNYSLTNKITPYLTTNFRLGIDLFEKNKKNCEFIECFREQNAALKINLMDVFYLDRNFQHINFSPEYEQRIGKSAFTFTINPSFRFYNRKVFPQKQFLLGDSNPFSYKIEFENYSYSTQTFYTELNTNLRWYFLLNKYIRKGQQNRNLDGLYALVGIKNVFMNNTRAFNPLSTSTNFNAKNVTEFGILTLGGGVQTIYKSKYFFDFNMSFGVSPFNHFKPSLYYSILSLKFGIVK